MAAAFIVSVLVGQSADERSAQTHTRRQAEWLYVGFKLLGGSYLCYLGWPLWSGAREATPNNSVPSTLPIGSLGRSFWLALATQLSNPKTLLVIGSIFAALLPAHIPGWMYVAIPTRVGSRSVAPRSNERSANLNVSFEAGYETHDAEPCRPRSRAQWTIQARELLEAGGAMSAAQLSEIETRVSAQIDAAVTFAEKSAPADPALAFDLMFDGQRP